MLNIVCYVGNRETLTDNNEVNRTVASMLEFYRKHYLPGVHARSFRRDKEIYSSYKYIIEKMTLSLVGPQSIAELSQLAVNYFSGQ